MVLCMGIITHVKVARLVSQTYTVTHWPMHIYYTSDVLKASALQWLMLWAKAFAVYAQFLSEQLAKFAGFIREIMRLD